MEEREKLPEYWNLKPWELAEIWGNEGFLKEMANGEHWSLDDETRNYYLYKSLAESLKRIEERLNELSNPH